MKLFLTSIHFTTRILFFCTVSVSALIFTSCTSPTQDPLPRTIELVETTTSNQPAVIRNSSGNVKIKSLTASFVATSLPLTTAEDTLGSGVRLLGSDKGITLNGKQVAIYDNNGHILPTENSAQWESRLEVDHILVERLPSPGNISAEPLMVKGIVKALPSISSEKNAKLRELYGLALDTVNIELAHPSMGPDTTTFPPKIKPPVEFQKVSCKYGNTTFILTIGASSIRF